jgi:glycosyltransferase involved in cell wall biosynthesis
VVLPYRTATQSGIIPIAYHFNMPVVASNVGGLPENIQNNKTGIICEPSPESIANGIINYFDSDLFIYKENIEQYKKQYTWKTFAKKIMELV